MDRDEKADDLFMTRLAEVLEIVEAGQEPDLESLCEEHPEWISRFEAVLRERRRLPRYHDESLGFDPLEHTVVADRFVLEERIGSGSMGVVYRATDRHLNRPVAVKMLRPEVVSGEEYDARLVREAEVLAALRHESLLTIHDRGVLDDGRSFLVMDLLEGFSGSEMIERLLEARAEGMKFGQEMDVLRTLFAADALIETSYIRQVVRWMERVARGLSVAHELGAVHRDIKPSNIFVRDDGSPILIDFGLATMGREHTLALREGTLGTPAYMAPEQLRLGAEATPRTDVYGLAATLYHLLSLKRPYDGTPQQVIASIGRRDPVPIRHFVPGLPVDLRAILDKAMMREPASRYDSAEALAEDLEAWLEFRPTKARPVGAIRRGLRIAKRSVALRTAAALILLALVIWGGIGVGSWIEERRRERHRPAYASIAPLHILRSPHLRRLEPGALLTQVEAILDTAVEYADDPVPERVIRAGFYLDQQSPELAARDFAVVAETHPSPLCNALASRYREHARNGAAAIDLEGLPHVESDVDRYVLAFHQVRSEDPRFEDSLGLLQDIEEDVRGAMDLELVIEGVLARRIERQQERVSTYLKLLSRCEELEAKRSGATAISSHVRATALFGLNRFEKSAEALEHAADLAPWDFGLWYGVGGSWKLAAEFDRARPALVRALEIQPASMASSELVEVEIFDGEFDRAEALLSEFDLSAPEKLRLKGLLCIARAESQSDPLADDRIANAQSAMRCFEELYRAHSMNLIWERAYSRLLIEKDPRVFTHAVRSLLDAPTFDFRKARGTALRIPEELDEEARLALRDLILRVVSEVSLSFRTISPTAKE